jgi:hypothetical protein
MSDRIKFWESLKEIYRMIRLYLACVFVGFYLLLGVYHMTADFFGAQAVIWALVIIDIAIQIILHKTRNDNK